MIRSSICPHSVFCLFFACCPPAIGAEQTQPDIVLVLADDMGYSDIGCYGSEISTPNLDRLAANGIRFTQFYNAARCCPTRAALLTGLYPHQTGVGESVWGEPLNEPSPTQGYLNQQCVTIAEALKPAGYRCYMSGKWHVGEFRPAWPIDRGFDRHYGLISGAMNYFDITKQKRNEYERIFARDDQQLFPGGDGFYATDAYGDEALKSLHHHADEYPDRPLFLYLAFTAPHWPLHAPEEVIQKYEGKYLGGWEKLRKERYQRMLDMGLIRPEWKLSPPDGWDWNQLDEDQKKEMDRRMAVYAAMVDRMDWNIGRVIHQLRTMNRLDNTLFLFLSDNGACHESGLLGTDMQPDLTGPTGSVNSYRTYGQSWSNASNTPFRKHKHWTHEGGIATPLIVHWPHGLQVKAHSITSQVGHVIDIMPTLCEVAGAVYPKQLDGRTITPVAGRSLVPVLRGEQLPSDRAIFWKHMGNAAMRQGSWKLVRADEQSWELYNLESDRSELHDLAAENPDVLTQMESAWHQWARNIGAIP